VTAHLHRHAPRDARPDHVADSRSPKIVRDTGREEVGRIGLSSASLCERRGDVTAGKSKRHPFLWLGLAFLANAVAIGLFEWLRSPYLSWDGLYAARVSFWGDLLLIDTIGAAWWAGLATWRQLRLAEAELRDNWVARRQELKPIVFSDYDLDSKRFVIRNVGGGFAVNVIGLVPTKDGGHEMPYLFGSLAAGDSRALHAEEIYAGFLSKHVLLAEGVWTRTAQWNPTLNVRNRWESVSHANGVADGGKTVLEARDLDTYLAANWKDLHAQLAKLNDAVNPPKKESAQTTAQA
jgi:hypothetical protein